MIDPIIKVGFLVSFDFKYLKYSLPLVYDESDLICIAIDNEYKSWSGNKFDFPEESFFSWIKAIDIENKIKIYFDNFHILELSAMENDTRERNLLSKFMGEGGWHIQVDTDEYFIDFPKFVSYLKSKKDFLKNPEKNPVDIGAFLIPLFKQSENGFIFIKDCFETVVIATNFPDYTSARRSKHFIDYTNMYLFHHTWARDEDQILFKLRNWGHVKDFNIESYFRLWKSIDDFNFKYIYNFHPIYNGLWKSLGYCEGIDIDSFIYNYKEKYSIKLPLLRFLLKKGAQLRYKIISK